MQPKIARPRFPISVSEAFVRHLLEHAMSRVFALPGRELWCPTRGRPAAASARQIAMYLAHVSLGLSLTEVGNVFGRDRTTVAHACQLTEDRRDDPVFDHALDLLDAALRFLAPAARHRA